VDAAVVGLEVKIDWQEFRDQLGLGPQVVGRPGDAHLAAAGDGERQQQLVAEMGADGGVGIEVFEDLVGTAAGDGLGRDALFAGLAEDFGQGVGFDFDGQRVARGLGLGHLEFAGLEVDRQGAEFLSQRRTFTVGDVVGQVGDDGGRRDPPNFTAVEPFDGLEAVAPGLDMGRNPPAPLRIKARLEHADLDIRPHAFELGDVGVVEELEQWGAPGVGSSLDDDLGVGIQAGHRRQKGLQHEDGRAGGADVEPVGAGLQFAGAKLQGPGADLGAGEFTVADNGDRLGGGQMLVPETGLRAVVADVLDTDRFPAIQGQRQGVAQHLAAPLAAGTVDFVEVVHDVTPTVGSVVVAGRLRVLA
jgi:hypothetical protein